MTNAAVEAFKEKLEALEIQVSQDGNGLFTICTRSEPFFCYDGESLEALKADAIATIAAYARRFHGIEAQVQEKGADLPFDVERPNFQDSLRLEAA